MTINVWHEGDKVRCVGVIEDAAGTDTDPSVVKFTYRTPSGVVTTLTHGVEAALEKDSPGNYHVDIPADEPGIYSYRFYSTGSGQAASRGQFRVRKTSLN